MLVSTIFLFAAFFVVLWDVEFLEKYESINNIVLAISQDDMLEVNWINIFNTDIYVVVFIWLKICNYVVFNLLIMYLSFLGFQDPLVLSFHGFQ